MRLHDKLFFLIQDRTGCNENWRVNNAALAVYNAIRKYDAKKRLRVEKKAGRKA